MRADIESYLSVVSEATAKTISIRIGIPHLDVAKELNQMHGDGIVEREKRKGGGNEYVYWLARANVPAGSNAVEPSASSETVSDAVLPPNIPEPDDLDLALAEEDLHRAAITTPEPRSPAVEKPEVEPVKTDADQAFAKLAGQTRELMDIFGLPPTMTEAIAAARMMMEIAKATSIDRDELRAEVESLKTGNARLKQNNAELEQRIDELTLGPVGAKSPLFVTVGRYAKPMRHDSLEKAQKRGKALVRNEKESEVLVCEPVGRVVRGTEWVTR